MRIYTFTVPGGQPEKKIEAMSLKKALNSFQTKAGNLKEVLVEWISRKGNPSSKLIKLPIKKRKNKYG